MRSREDSHASGFWEAQALGDECDETTMQAKLAFECQHKRLSPLESYPVQNISVPLKQSSAEHELLLIDAAAVMHREWRAL